MNEYLIVGNNCDSLIFFEIFYVVVLGDCGVGKYILFYYFCDMGDIWSDFIGDFFFYFRYGYCGLYVYIMNL